MSHWRDGGIGNMAGSDDREAGEFTVLEKLTVLMGHSRTGAKFSDMEVLQEAFDEIERLRIATIYHQWQPIDTAPVEPWDKVPNYYSFPCLLQDARDQVFAGEAYYTTAPRSPERRILRWRGGAYQRQCFPVYWMPLPAPKVAS